MSIIPKNDDAAFAELAAVMFTLPMPVAILDLETTGGHFEQDRITEIAILRFQDGLISRHHWLLNPEQPISEFVIRLTGISNKMVQNAPVFKDIASELLSLLRGHLIVAHNSRFDYTFLRHAFARVGIGFAAPTLDTVPFSRKLYPQYFKHNLDAIIARFDIEMAITDRHRAMGDVLALTEFLQSSLREQTVKPWLKQWHVLVKPGYLPAWLTTELRQQLYALPDRPGLAVLKSAHTSDAVTMVFERAFTEIGLLLQNKNEQKQWQQIMTIEFIPAVSVLHALWLQGHYQLRHDLKNNLIRTGISSNWYTINFVPNCHGQLQARIVRLEEGILSRPPYGLFPHPRAAKRALADWARQFQLCPAVLDITPKSLSLNDPCPNQAADLCDGHCRQSGATALLNERILHFAPLLPVCDWGKWHYLRITESDEVTNLISEIDAQAGCIRLDEQSWYFHSMLPKIIKQRLKKPKNIAFIR